MSREKQGTESREAKLRFFPSTSDPRHSLLHRGNRGGTRFMLKTFQFLDATAALVALLLSQAQAQDDSELAKKT